MGTLSQLLIRSLCTWRDNRSLKWSVLFSAAVGLLLIAGGEANALPQGLSYSLAPTIDHVMWDGELGLREASLYGGRLSLNFGRIVSLQGHYFTNNNVKTDLSAVRYDGEPIDFARDQELRINRYGADMIFNLGGGGGFVPFLRLGGGVVQFQPEASSNLDVIALSTGGGFRFAFLERFQAQLYVEDLMFRVDRQRLVPDPSSLQAGLAIDPARDDIRHNLVLGGNLIINLGGYPADQETELDRAIRSRYAGGLFGASWPIEPFVGKIKFDSHAGLDDQPYAGLRTGLNFGQLIGLRGYFWRGMNDDFNDTDPVQSYGGEAQFNLNSGQGAIPYLLLGAGQLDFLGDYRDKIDSTRSDKTMLIAGGGLGFTLGRHLRVNLAARDYIFSESDYAELSDPGKLLHNWSYSAGLTFAFGGKKANRGQVDALGRERWTPAPSPVQPGPAESDQIGETATPPPAPTEKAAFPYQRDTLRTTEFIVLPDSLPTVRTFQGDRVVALPVPEVGEIYIRYGQPGGVMIKSDHFPGSAAMADTTRPDSTAPAVASPPLSDDERLELLTRSLEERLGERLERKIDERLNVLVPNSTGSAPQTVVVSPPVQSPSTTIIRGPESTGTADATGERKIFHTYTGLNVNDPAQFLLGARLDAGPIANNRSLRFVPELAFGFFSKGSFMLTGNAMYNFGPFPGSRQISPYVYAGLGLIRFGKGVDRDRTEGVLNVGYGMTKPVGQWIGFIEHQGVDLFSLNRINAGIRWLKN